MTAPKSLSRTAPSAVAATSIVSSLLTVQTKGAGFTDLTSEVAKFIRDARAREGAVTLFIRHTSASLTIQENADPTVLTDLTTALNRLAPENAGWRHDTEGPDDMPAHIKTMLTATSLQIPVLQGAAGARHVAGDLSGRAPRAAAPARGRAAVHGSRRLISGARPDARWCRLLRISLQKQNGRGSLRGRCVMSVRRFAPDE